MNIRTSDWETVWAEYDARAGAPKWQSHTPWYMDPTYMEAQEPTPEARVGRGRPFMLLASMAVVLLAFMLNIRFVPEHPVHAAAPWQPVVAPVAMVSFGTPAEASPTPPPVAALSDFGDLLALPPPDWVRAERAPGGSATVQAARDAVLQRVAATARGDAFATARGDVSAAARESETAPLRDAFAAREARPRQPQPRQAAAHRTASRRYAQARPAQPRQGQAVASRTEQVAAALPMPDQLCAPPQRQHASAGQMRRPSAARATHAGDHAVLLKAAPTSRQGSMAAASTGTGNEQRPAKFAMAGAPRAPPGAQARS